MPIVRKIIDIGTSKGITLPKSWLKFYENEVGKQIESVAIEVNKILTIQPIVPKEKKKQ